MRYFYLLISILFCLSSALADPGAKVSQGTTVSKLSTIYTGTITATTNGSAYYLPKLYSGLIFRQTATINSGTSPTLDTKIQHSIDGTTWVDLPSVAFTQLTAGTSTEELHIDVTKIKTGGRVRAVLTLGGTTPNVTAEVSVIHD